MNGNQTMGSDNLNNYELLGESMNALEKETRLDK
jgi:hypothetical protein